MTTLDGVASDEMAERHGDTLMAILTKAYPKPSSHIVAAGAGWVYDRKGHDTVDPLGHPRNVSYSSGSDDAIITVTIRVSCADARSAGLIKLEEMLLLEQRDRLSGEVSSKQAALEAAEHRLGEVTKRLERITKA